MWVANAYPIDVQIRAMRVSAVIEGSLQLPPIVESPNVWLRSNTKTNVTVSVFIPWNLVPRLLSQTLGHTVLEYRVRGLADITATQAFRIERDDYEVDEKGKVSRAELLAAAALGGIQMR